MPPSTERLQQISTMYAAHDGELHRLFERRGSPEHTTVEDAARLHERAKCQPGW